MWKNIVEPDTPKMAIWRMRIAWWITKATDTYSEYVIIIAFALQQWLHDRPSMLRDTYIACRVFAHKSSAKQKMIQSKASYKQKIRWFAFHWDEFRTWKRYAILEVVTLTPTKMQVFWDVTQYLLATASILESTEHNTTLEKSLCKRLPGHGVGCRRYGGWWAARIWKEICVGYMELKDQTHEAWQ